MVVGRGDSITAGRGCDLCSHRNAVVIQKAQGYRVAGTLRRGVIL